MKVSVVSLLLCGAAASPLQPDFVAKLQAADTCTTQASPTAYTPFVCDGTGDSSITTSFGRSESAGCACKACAGATTTTASATVTAPTLSTAADAGLCLSTDPAPPTVIFDSATTCSAAYECEVTVGAYTTASDPTGATKQAMKDQITTCLTPDRTSTTLPSATMFVIGDSYAGAVAPALAYAALGRYQVRTSYIVAHGVLASTGSALDTYTRQTASEGGPDLADLVVELGGHYTTTLASLMTAGDVVVVAELTTNWLEYRSPGPDASLAAYTVLESGFIPAVETASANMLLLAPYNSSAGSPVNRQAQAWEAMQTVAGRHTTSVSTHNLFPYFCDADLPASTVFTDIADDTSNTTALPACSNLVPGTSIPAFRDNYHLNAAGDIYLWPYLCSALTTAGLMGAAK
jgi:hypothetical protein